MIRHDLLILPIKQHLCLQYVDFELLDLPQSNNNPLKETQQGKRFCLNEEVIELMPNWLHIREAQVILYYDMDHVDKIYVIFRERLSR